MMTSATTSPPIPVPDRQIRVTFRLTEPGANHARVWCTQAPAGSALQARLEKARLSRVLVYEGAAGIGAPWRHTFDKGGAYELRAQEYRKGNNWGGAYEGDPRGAPTETKTGEEATFTLQIAKKLSQRLGAGNDSATLVLFVRGNTIEQTIATVHGEATPAIVNPTSERAATAAGGTDIQDAFALLAGQSTSTAIGSLATVVSGMITVFAAHATSALRHETADDQADLADLALGDSTSPGGIAAALNKLRRRLSQHMANSKENDPAHPEYQIPGSIAIHDHNGLTADLSNALLPITADENDTATLFAAIGDTWRAYEAHRLSDMHESADTAHTFSALPSLANVHRLFLTALATTAPTAAPGQSIGAAQLIASGFTAE